MSEYEAALAERVMEAVVYMAETCERGVIGVSGELGIGAAMVGPNAIVFTKMIFPGVFVDMVLN